MQNITEYKCSLLLLLKIEQSTYIKRAEYEAFFLELLKKMSNNNFTLSFCKIDKAQ